MKVYVLVEQGPEKSTVMDVFLNRESAIKEKVMREKISFDIMGRNWCLNHYYTISERELKEN